MEFFNDDIMDYFVMFQNISQLCWLNSSLNLLSHNEILRKIDEGSELKAIIERYHGIIQNFNVEIIYNDCDKEMKLAHKKLKSLQKDALNYLKPFMKTRDGEPDSAFCAIMNLICHNESVRKLFEVKIRWKLKCKMCKKKKVQIFDKTIITLCKVDRFNPVAPTAVCACISCKAPNQERQMSYLNDSKCMIFHFENGAGNGSLEELQDFVMDNKRFHMTGLILIKKISRNFNHFITWIRNPESNYWLECDDLITDLVMYTQQKPNIKCKDIYMLMYETRDD